MARVGFDAQKHLAFYRALPESERRAYLHQSERTKREYTEWENRFLAILSEMNLPPVASLRATVERLYPLGQPSFSSNHVAVTSAALCNPRTFVSDPVCRSCQRTEDAAALKGQLYCCGIRVCTPCLFSLVFGNFNSSSKTRANVSKQPVETKPCPVCHADPRAALRESIAAERKRNPNEVHISSVVFPKADGLRLPLTSLTSFRHVMDAVSERVGFPLDTQVEGGYVAYKLVFRDRLIEHQDCYKTLAEAGWISGIAHIKVVNTSLPAYLHRLHHNNVQPGSSEP